MLSRTLVVVLLTLTCGVMSQELPPTEQTVFDYPANGTGVSLPFPSDLARLTGLSQWPTKWVTPPFTPNMAKLFNPSSKAILPDIVGPPNVKEFCQTFDDGPTNVTPQLLDFLDSVNQKTTFSEIGSRIIENYQITQREYASGHQIVDHTWSHPNLTSLSMEAVYAELAWTIYAIHAAIGQTPKYFRPPYGFINNNVRQVAAQLGLTAVLWTDNTQDWQIGSNPVYTYDSVTQTIAGVISGGGGQIVLEHVLREATIEVGITVSGMVSKAGRINCPVAAVVGDAQRYQGTNLTWPVVGPNGFDASVDVIKGVVESTSIGNVSPTATASAISGTTASATAGATAGAMTGTVSKSGVNTIVIGESIWALIIAISLGGVVLGL